MRPRSHILETESRKAFDQVIPSEWVIRSEHPDYGLDVQVQIFENGRITPFLFYVQLKGTDTIPAGSNTPSWPFSTKRLLDYFQSAFPVMLVLFDANSKRLFCEWAHDIHMKLSQEEKRKLHTQETFTVRFYRVLNSENTRIIEKEVRNQFFRLGYQPSDESSFTIVVHLAITDHDIQILKALSHWLSKEPCTRFLRIREKDAAPDGAIRVLADSSGESPLVISITCLSNELFYPLQVNATTTTDDLLTDLILAIALILSAAGRFNSALDVLSRFFSEERPLTVFATEVLTDLSLARMYVGSKRTAEALEIAERLLNRGYLQPAIVMSSAVPLADNPPFYEQQYRRFLKAIIESDAGKDDGAHEYNLANSLRQAGYSRLALRHYRRAALKDRSYRTRSYWYAELAGCLFLLDRFRWSEAFYRKALALGETRLPVRAGLGDALLYQGRFDEAKVELVEHLRTVDAPLADAVLKYWMASILFQNFGNTRRNHPIAHKLLERAFAIDDLQSRELLLRESIASDPLYGLAWFNYAVSGAQRATGRAWRWLIAAILQPWDVSAWANAVLLITNEGFKEMELVAAAAICEAFRVHGYMFERTLEEILSQQPNLTEQAAGGILSAMNEIKKKCSSTFQREPLFVLRKHGN